MPTCHENKANVRIACFSDVQGSHATWSWVQRLSREYDMLLFGGGFVDPVKELAAEAGLVKEQLSLLACPAALCCGSTDQNGIGGLGKQTGQQWLSELRSDRLVTSGETRVLAGRAFIVTGKQQQQLLS